MSELNLGTLTVTIEAAVAEFTKQIESVSKAIEELGDTKRVALGVSAAFAGMAGGIALVTKASAEATAEQVKLNAMISASGKAIDPAAINALAQATQNLSIFDDDAVVSASALLVRLGMEQKQIEALIPGVADLATALGVDLSTAAQIVGRSIATGSVMALTKAGIAFDEAAQEAFKFADANERTRLVSEKLQATVGGVAQAMAGTAVGALSSMHSAVGNLAEAFGSVFEPMAGAALRSVSGSIDGLRASFEALSPAVKGALALLALATTALTGLAAAGLGLVVIWPKLIAGFAAVKVGVAAIGAATGIALAPVLAVTAALGAVVLAGIAFSDLLESLGGASAIWQGIKATVGGVFDSITGWIGEVGSKIRDAIPQAFRDAFSGIAQFNVDVWDTVIGGFLEPVKILAQAIFDLFSTIGGALGDVLGTTFDYWAGKLAKIGQGPKIPKPGAPKAAGPAPFSMLGDVGAGGEGVRLDAKAEAQKEVDALARERARIAKEAAKTAEREANALIDELYKPPETAMAKAGREGAALLEHFKGIEGAAAEARREFEAGLDAAGGDFVQGMSGSFYNFAEGVFGPGAIAEGAAAIGEALDQVGAQLAGKLLGSMGEIGSTITAGMEGFQQGGPMGAAAAVLTELITSTPEFTQVVGFVNDALKDALSMLSRLLRGFAPLARAVGSVLAVVSQLLEPVFSSLGEVFAAIGIALEALVPMLVVLQPVFKLLGEALGLVARAVAGVMFVVLAVMRSVAEVWNGIVSAVQRVLYKLGGIEVFGKKPLGFLEDWGDSLNKAKLDTEGLGDAMDELATIVETGAASDEALALPEDLAAGMDGAADAASDFAGAATEATEALTNVPQGFKVAAARFEATQEAALDAGAFGGTPGGGTGDSAMAGMMAPVTIESVEIKSDDPQAIWTEIKRLIAWDNFSQGGSTQPMAQPYAVQKVT